MNPDADHAQPAGGDLPAADLPTTVARLAARLESMPVIEQAKGIIMAGTGLTEADAFDLLRRASQQRNVPVRDLAAQIVACTIGNPQP